MRWGKSGEGGNRDYLMMTFWNPCKWATCSQTRSQRSLSDGSSGAQTNQEIFIGGRSGLSGEVEEVVGVGQWGAVSMTVLDSLDGIGREVVFILGSGW